MNQLLPARAERKGFSARRLVLLASAAGLAIAVTAGAPSSFNGPKLPAFTAPAYADNVQPSAGFADIVAKVKPAVISVRVKIDETAKTTGMGEGGDGEANPRIPFEKFFEQFGRQGMPQGQPRGKQGVTGEGSGFLISVDGYAVTNNHVVDGAKTVQVTTDDGAVYKAKVVGTDAKTDLALIKVESDKSFPFVKFADREPRIGDWVVAVGNPFGLGGTVTAGIVSARGRDIGAGPYNDYIQIDAPINKGNSGGPTFNTEGNVIGVNTAIFSPSGGSVGIGFDIPAEAAKMVVAQLKEHGYVDRAWLGVQVQPVTAEIADSLGLKKAEGAIVAEPQADSPATKVGVVAGDVITAIDGTAVKDSRDLARKIGMMAPGSRIKLAVTRKGEAKTLDLTLAKMPDQTQAKAEVEKDASTSGPRLGLNLAPAKDVGGAGSEGVAVVGVDPNGPASERGIKTGDVILDVGGKAVTNVADVRKALSDARSAGKSSILLRVKSAEAMRFVALPIGKA
ncbi:MAG: Do family serine endopeptidase [Pseudolabrys sp.]|jgi:serine protease Do